MHDESGREQNAEKKIERKRERARERKTERARRQERFEAVKGNFGRPRATVPTCHPLKRIHWRSSFAESSAGGPTSPSDPDKIVENVSTPHDDPHSRDPPIVPASSYLNARHSPDTLIIRTLPMRRDPELPDRARAGNPFRAKFRGATGMHRVGSSLDPGRAARPRAPTVVKTGGNMA